MAKAAVGKAKAAKPEAGTGPRTVAIAASPAAATPPAAREPLWLVRIVFVLFLVGFAAFLAREIYNFLHTL